MTSAAPPTVVALPRPLLAARDLRKRYGAVEALAGVTVEVGAGEVVGLLGPNGAGKTTCFRLLLGLERPDGGAIRLGAEDVTRAPAHLRARAGLGYLAQDPSAFRGLSAWENVAVALEGLPRDRRPRGPGALEREARARLEEIGLGAVADRSAAVLSGGERRKLEIARAMAARPAVLLLDEPFAGVDPRGVSELRTTIASLRARGVGLLLTDHRVAEALESCDRAYVLDRGVVLRHGKPEEVVADPNVRTAFLGPDFGPGMAAVSGEP